LILSITSLSGTIDCCGVGVAIANERRNKGAPSCCFAQTAASSARGDTTYTDIHPRMRARTEKEGREGGGREEEREKEREKES
jgi:hypothetical protein